MVGNKFAVFSLLNKQVQLLRPSDLKEMNLKAMFGALWCEQHYNEFDAKKEEVVFNHKRLATDILSACQAAGPYSETAERRVGVWKMNDGQLVVNGRQLWRADGTVLEHGIHEGRVYPVSGDVGFDLSTPWPPLRMSTKSWPPSIPRSGFIPWGGKSCWAFWA